MIEKKYEVMVDDEFVARDMTLDVAMILVRGLFGAYYEEHTMRVTIKEMARSENEG